jgi:outer membrane protein assembly complex protein YaeT
MRLKLPLIALAIFALLAANQAWGQEEADPLDSYGLWATGPEAPWQVVSVEFKGFKAVTPDDARSVLEYKQPAGKLLPRPEPYDPLKVQRDLRRLALLFKEQGYFQAKVSVKLKRHPADKTIRMTLVAQQGLPTKVSQIKLLWPDEEARLLWQPFVEKLLRVKVGHRFVLADYEQSKQEIVKFFSNQSHPTTKVLGQVQVQAADQRAVVVLKITPGRRLLFGKVKIKGNRRIGEKFIKDEKTFAQGQPFSLDAMEQTQQALLDSGFFAVVSLHPLYGKIDGGMVPILMDVRERPPHSIKLRLGWGNEDRLRVGVQQVNRNVLGLNDTFTIEGKISSIYAGMVGALKVPYIFNRRSTMVIRGGIEQSDTEAFINNRLFINPAVEYRMDKDWSWFLGYNSEVDRIRELKTNVPDPVYEKQAFYISSFPMGAVYDSRNSVLDPTKGRYFRFEVETALKALGSEIEFIRPVIDWRHVRALPWKDCYLAFRARAGIAYALPGTSKIPLIRRFYPGGAYSVRGYPWQKLGPLDSSGKPFGGESMAIGSVEIRFPLYKELGGVVFVDGGNAWDDVLSQDIGVIRLTSGVGLRYATPVGPIRLDFGYQINPPDNALQDRYEVYLSVGQAF